MAKFIYFLGSAIAAAAAALLIIPALAIIAAVRVWQWIALRGAYGGDTSAFQKDRWRAN